MEKVKKAIEKTGIPGRDIYEIPNSDKTFPDGAHYRMEISGVERPSTLEALIDEVNKRNIPVHRLISTVMGSTLLDKKELKSFAKMASDAKMEVIITPGPRPLWDLGKQIATPEGALSGLRIRGSDNLNLLVSDIMRCIDIGFRGFLVWDEGVLYLLNKMRENGDIPSDVVFKVSIYAGHANAGGAKVLENLGANTFNPVGDLSLPMLASIRKAADIPMDIHVILFESMGGFNRMWETPELARVASPCYFKIEPGVSSNDLYRPWVSEELLANIAREKVKYAQIIKEIIEENQPDLKLSEVGSEDLAIPKI